MFIESSRLALAAAFVSAVMSAAPAKAQAFDADALEFADADVIVVTGTKQGLTLQESDVSVELFTPERLDREVLFDLDDVLQRVPNVTSIGLASDINIRGIGRNGLGSAGQGVTSNVYLDGAPIATTALSFGFESLWDVAQVEVLRGPQSTIQGRNALAGAIVITTNDPAYDWELTGRARYGEFDTQQYAATISGPIVPDQVAFRVTADYQETDGFIDNVLVDRQADDKDNILVRGKLLVEPEALPGLRVELIGDYNDSNLGIASTFVNAGVPVTDPTFSAFDFSAFDTFNSPQEQDAETVRAIADLAYEIVDGIVLRAVGTFEDTDRRRVIGDLATPTLFPTNGINDDGTETYSAELRAEYEIGRWSGLFGAYYFEDEQDFSLDFLTPLAPQVFFPINPIDTFLAGNLATESDTQNYAFYGQTRFELNDRWTFSFGLRYDREEFTTTGQQVAAPTVSPANCIATVPGALVGAPLPTVDVPCAALLPSAEFTPLQSDTFDAFLPRGSITYNFTPDISVFFSGQRGYRAGGTFISQSAAGVEVGTFDPEFLTNYEIGVRSLLLDGTLRVNGNVFFSELDDQQVIIPGPSGSFLDQDIVNAGESTIYGLELLVDYEPVEGLNLYGTLGLLETEIDDFPFAVPGAPFENLAGNDLPQAPGVSFTVGGSYQHRTGFFIDASLNHIGSLESDLENLGEDDFIAAFEAAGFDPALAEGLTERVPSRTVVNGRLGYEHERFTAYVYAQNLFDDTAITFTNLGSVNTADGSLNFFDTPSETFVFPRVIGVGLDFNF
ncbi:MAG: TonB-dependent receptor [Pseudomonadota bacterium]